MGQWIVMTAPDNLPQGSIPVLHHLHAPTRLPWALGVPFPLLWAQLISEVSSLISPSPKTPPYASGTSRKWWAMWVCSSVEPSDIYKYGTYLFWIVSIIEYCDATIRFLANHLPRQQCSFLQLLGAWVHSWIPLQRHCLTQVDMPSLPAAHTWLPVEAGQAPGLCLGGSNSEGSPSSRASCGAGWVLCCDYISSSSLSALACFPYFQGALLNKSAWKSQFQSLFSKKPNPKQFISLKIFWKYYYFVNSDFNCN